jgi:hypothetical protein
MKKTAFFLLVFALPGPASAGTTAFALAFTNADNEAIWIQYTGQCYEVKIKDSGSETPLSSAETVHLSATSGGFYSDSDCKNSIISVTIAANSNSATAYFEATSAAKVTVTLQAQFENTGPVSTEAIITVVAMSQLGFDPDPLTQSIGTCGALKVEAQDSSGQAVAVTDVLGTVTIYLGTSSSTAAFYSDSSCTSSADSVSIAPGSSSVTVYYKDTTAQDSSTLQAQGMTNPNVSEDGNPVGPYMVTGTGNATITSTATSN